MNNIQRRTPALLLAIGLLGLGMAQAQDPTKPNAAVLKSHIMVAPDEVVWGECPPLLPRGARCATIEGDPKAANALFALRLKAPDDYRIPPHFHPADEHVVVISGILNMGLGDTLDTKAGRALPAGSFMAMPAGEHHYAWVKGETVVQIYAIGPWGLTYVNPQDDPRNRPKDAEN